MFAIYYKMNIKQIPTESLEKLKENETVTRQLSSKNLQVIIEDIMKNENDYSTLENYLDNNPHFNAFVLECLRATGSIEDHSHS